MPAPAASAGRRARPADFTVYFDFDSWTLTAEDLKVITDVINTARAGGQTHITIVGHTDTSGSADYNQKLSVRRANVVVEALVDMGARRAAIQAIGRRRNRPGGPDRRQCQGSQEPPRGDDAAALITSTS